MERNKMEVILLIEDDPGVVELARDKLEKDGRQIIHAATGKIALKWLESNRAHLVLLDYSLPDINGAELVKRVKAGQEGMPPFIVVTGMGDERVAVAMMKEGAKDYLVKDSNFIEILPMTVEKVLNQIATENQLAVTLQHLNAHIDNSPLAVMEFDSQFRVIRWSKEAERVFGWTAEEILGKSKLEMRLVYDDDVTLVSLDYAALLSGEKTRSLNVNRNYRKDGSVIRCEWYNSAIHDQNGELISVLSLALDITERKRAEEDLLWNSNVNEALAALYLPLTSSHSTIHEIASVVLDQARSLTQSEHGYVSEVDPLTGDNIGHTLTEMMRDLCNVRGDGLQKIAFPRGNDGRYGGLWGHALNTKRGFYANSPQKFPVSSGAPDGHIPLERFLSAPVLLSDELVGQIALANSKRDYTERDLQAVLRLAEYYALAIQRKRSEKLLHQSEDRFSRTFRSNPAAILITRLTDDRILDANPNCERLFEQARADLIGHTAREFGLHIDLAQNNELHEQETSLKLKSGEARELLILSDRVDFGGEACALVSIQDVTARTPTEKYVRDMEKKYGDLYKMHQSVLSLWMETRHRM